LAYFLIRRSFVMARVYRIMPQCDNALRHDALE